MSDTPSERAPSAARDDMIYDYHSSEAAGAPPSLTAGDIAAHNRLERMGEVKPGDSVSAVGDSPVSRNTFKEASTKSKLKSTASAKMDRPEAPASLANIGMKAKIRVAAGARTNGGDTILESDDPDVDQWLNDLELLRAEVEAGIAKGFKSVDLHEAWLDIRVKESHELGTRKMAFSNEDQEKCSPDFNAIVRILRKQENVVMAKRSALRLDQIDQGDDLHVENVHDKRTGNIETSKSGQPSQVPRERDLLQTPFPSNDRLDEGMVEHDPTKSQHFEPSHDLSQRSPRFDTVEDRESDHGFPAQKQLDVQDSLRSQVSSRRGAARDDNGHPQPAQLQHVSRSGTLILHTG
jgi:hypothetical protein